MKSFKFKEVNTVFAEDNEQLETHSFVDNSIKGNKDIVSCYSVSFKEALLMLVTGKIWVNVTSFNGKLHPMRLSAVKKDMILTRKQARSKNKAIEKYVLPDNHSDPSNNGIHVVS